MPLIRAIPFSCPIFESLAMVTGLPTPVSVVPAGGMGIYTEPTYLDRASNLFTLSFNYVLSTFDQYRTTKIFRDKFG